MNTYAQDEERAKRPSLQVGTMTLPEHVAFDHILPKLPVKSLLRFKSVSKGWFSLISSPEFIKTHLERSSSAYNEFLLLNNCEFFTLSYDEHDLKEWTPLGDAVHKLGERLTFVGCCNGLVCVYVYKFLHRTSESGSFVIWNPAISVYTTVDLPERYCGKYSFLCDIHGFGYASSDDDYKIVNISSAHTAVCVFSLKQRKWKINYPNQKYDHSPEVYYGSGVYVDDTLFWTSDDDKTCLLSYNLVTQKLKEVAGEMNWASTYKETELHVIGGCLALCCYERNDGADVWIRKRKHGLSESLWEWEKVFVIATSMRMEFINFSRFGHRLVIQSKASSKLFKLVDLSVGEIEHSKCIECHDCGGFQEIVHYVQSLILPSAGNVAE